MTNEITPEIIREDARKEAAERSVKAASKLKEDIEDAQRRYEEEQDDIDRVYKLRLSGISE
jgi:hypothetical protein